MLPLRDLNPTRRLPLFTYGLIGLNVIIFLWEMSLSPEQLQQAFMQLSVVPANVSADPFSLETLLDMVRSMFFHGGYEHIFGNMLYLWLFGDNVEDRFGGIFYLILYFVSGFVAAIAQVLIDPTSTIPLVGASGAIAGVLGGYLVLFPNIKVQGLMPLGRISTMTEMPAWVVLGFWFVLQLFNGVTSLGAETATGGVAFFAHVGGFVAGLVLAIVFMQIAPQPPANQRRELLYQRARR
ncbi:MAG: rhomboid family intramembrane serine protease [Anaerolineaceae bacterium]|nr:rhomboid family intramembrane serine protease [Anaerolineaceae bacterium]